MKTRTKELIFTSVYREVFYHVDKKMIEMNYLSGTSDYTDEEFKQEMLSLCHLLTKKELNLYCLNTVNLDYIIIPEMQKWVRETINPVLIKAGVKKLAIITSQQVFSKVSVKQMIDRLTIDVTAFETQYFTNEETATEWLLA